MELEAELGEARRNLDVSKTHLETMKMESERKLEDWHNTNAQLSSDADLALAQINSYEIKIQVSLNDFSDNAQYTLYNIHFNFY